MATTYPPVLPKPDEYGSYYLRRDQNDGSKAVILPSCINRGKFHAADSLGYPLVEGPSLRWFDSALEALTFLRAREGEN